MVTRTARPAGPRRQRSRRRGPRPPLEVRHFRRYLRARAARMAPADVRTLLGRAAEIGARARADGASRPALRRDAELALALLRDHAAGRVSHVPYSGVALLAAALFYYLDPIDVIPDFVRGTGTADDALVFALARREAADAVARYEAWREETPGRPQPARPRVRAR